MKHNLARQKFGRLFVIGYQKTKGEKGRWKCKCSCGTLKVIDSGNLRNGSTKSCGCMVREKKAFKQSHKTLYRIWLGMRDRCLNSTDPGYQYYGGRGITICKRWMKFENFVKDMGERPPGLFLERKNNNKGYSKSNCKWATRLEQANNKRNNKNITYKGKTRTLAQWNRHKGLPPGVIGKRLLRGWSIEKAIETPLDEMSSQKSKTQYEIFL